MPRAFSARLLSVAIVALFIIAGEIRAHASLITAGQTLEPTPAVPGLGGGGTIVAQILNQPFSTGSGFSFYAGTLTSTAIKNDSANPFGPNLMTFVFKLSNGATSMSSIERMTNIGFFDPTFGWQTNVTQLNDGLGAAKVDRSVSADVLGWSFTNHNGGPGFLDPGLTSASLVVHTNAPGVDFSLANIIVGSVVQVQSLQPSISIIAPEPATIGLLLISGGLMLRRRQT